MAHDLLAFWAFGVLFPLASTTAVLRDISTAGCSPTVPGFCKGPIEKLLRRWLLVHAGLNAPPYVVTLIAFSVAVTATVRAGGHAHFCSATQTRGLAVVAALSYRWRRASSDRRTRRRHQRVTKPTITTKL